MNSKSRIVTSAADGCGKPLSIRPMNNLPSRDHKGAEYKESFMLSNRSSFSRGCFLAAAALGVVALVSGTASAALVAYEPFNYPVGPGPSSTTPTTALGFTGDWVTSQTNMGTINAGSLNDPTGTLVTTGNSLAVSTSAYGGGENFDTSAMSAINTLSTSSGTTAVYYSALLQPTAAPSQWWGFGLGYTNKASDGSYGLFVGTMGQADWGINELGSSTIVYSSVPIVNGTTALLVVQDVRPTSTSGTDTINLYVNPTPGAAIPVTPSATMQLDLAEDPITNLYIGGATKASPFSIDEFRAGTTWASVTPPVPEPATLGLFAVGAAGLLLLLKRRKAV